ncbi:hypothetical protein ACICHK_41715 (plasmid) [Streptomyces sp. AHU1]|uniref:hypothetical protein n=1 Tax=Streptomyces sp. AHU1 TaxID=3377215 RepID=UPI0038780B58
MDPQLTTRREPVEITLDLLYELLGIERHWEPIVLLRNARAVRGHLPPLVLSVAQRSGVAMGPGSLAELDRMRRRAATYEALADELTLIPGTRVLKGPSLAARYPEGVLRPLGDLDVVVPDEARLWQAAARVYAAQPVDGIDITVLGDAGRRHIALALRWPSEDPMLDPELKVEISTFAYPGQPGTVPLRAATPAEQVHADLLALAEERFQRPFTVKDMLDLAVVLTSPDLPSHAEIARTADDFRLAPELLELCEAATGNKSLAPAVPEELTRALRALAPAEHDRRSTPTTDTDAPDPSAPAAPHTVGTVRDRLAAGQPVHGMLLELAPTAGPGTEATTEDFSTGTQKSSTDPSHTTTGTLLRTPLGVFLLVDGEIVDPALHEAARTALHKGTS